MHKIRSKLQQYRILLLLDTSAEFFSFPGRHIHKTQTYFTEDQAGCEHNCRGFFVAVSSTCPQYFGSRAMYFALLTRLLMTVVKRIANSRQQFSPYGAQIFSHRNRHQPKTSAHRNENMEALSGKVIREYMVYIATFCSIPIPIGLIERDASKSLTQKFSKRNDSRRAQKLKPHTDAVTSTILPWISHSKAAIHTLLVFTIFILCRRGLIAKSQKDDFSDWK
jgi:hypothetical protein